MSHSFYLWLHLTSVFAFLLISGLILGHGSLMAQAALAPKKFKNPEEPLESFRSQAKWQGLTLLLILVSGFGLIHRLGIHFQKPFPFWLLAKIGIWFLLGGSLALIKRKQLPVSLLIFGILILASLATSLGLWKPSEAHSSGKQETPLDVSPHTFY